MSDNPFRIHAAPKKKEVLEIPENVLPGGNYCPLLTSTDLGWVQAPQDAKAILAGQVTNDAQPVLAPKFLRCVGSKCAFWSAAATDCKIALGLDALNRLVASMTEAKA